MTKTEILDSLNDRIEKMIEIKGGMATLQAMAPYKEKDFFTTMLTFFDQEIDTLKDCRKFIQEN